MNTTPQLAALRQRQIALLRDLVSRDRPRTPAEQQAAQVITSELDRLRADINCLKLGQQKAALDGLINDHFRSNRDG